MVGEPQWPRRKAWACFEAGIGWTLLFVLAMGCALLLVILFPALALWLPRWWRLAAVTGAISALAFAGTVFRGGEDRLHPSISTRC